MVREDFFKYSFCQCNLSPRKKIVDFLFFPGRKTLKTVVLSEYPRKGVYSLGFLTEESSPLFKEKTGRDLYNVFVPSSPSPLTGFTIIVPKDEVIFLDIKVEEAMKLIISGGLANPYG